MHKIGDVDKKKYYSYVRKSLLDLIPDDNRNGKLFEIGIGQLDSIFLVVKRKD